SRCARFIPPSSTTAPSPVSARPSNGAPPGSTATGPSTRLARPRGPDLGADRQQPYILFLKCSLSLLGCRPVWCEGAVMFHSNVFHSLPALILRLSISLIFLLGPAILASALAQDRRQNAPGEFDFYVLALSWSPSFCEAAAERGNGG